MPAAAYRGGRAAHLRAAAGRRAASDGGGGAAARGAMPPSVVTNRHYCQTEVNRVVGDYNGIGATTVVDITPFCGSFS